MGLLTGRADSKTQYICIWNGHINDLTPLLRASNIPSTEWETILLPLRNAVMTAADSEERDFAWGAFHDPAAVEGYPQGIIRSNDMPPFRHFTDRGDEPEGNLNNPNDWFEIGELFYNVHPYRADLGGYPVRWIDAEDPREWER